MKQPRIGFFLAFLLLFLAPLSSVQADASEGTVGYSVQAILPDNQQDSNVTYFDLLMEPNQEQDIQVEIFNTTNEDAVIKVAVTNAVSNRNGVIDYTNTEAEVDSSLATPLTEIAVVESPTVSIPAASSKIVTVHLEMPPEEFDGIILGGLYFEKQPTEDETQSEGVSIENRYSYVIGVQLSETDTVIAPDLQLKNVGPGLANGRTALIAEIQNTEPVILRNLDITTAVYDEHNELIRSVKSEDYSMAPNSTMDYTIDWENQKIEGGEYIVNLHATNGQREWTWEKRFFVEKQEAAGINEEAVELDNNRLIGSILLGTFLVLAGIILILILYIRKLKRKMTVENQSTAS